MSLQTSEKFLQEIVSTVVVVARARGGAAAVVRLLTDASGVHACFVYLVRGRRPARAAAASAPYGGIVGQDRARAGRGARVVGGRSMASRRSSARTRSPTRARSTYPSSRRSGSSRSSPCPSSGARASAIGAITAHTEAPREFTDDEVDFLVSSASLVAGAIENARLYEETRRRVAELEQLTELAEAIARAEALDELLPGCRARAPRLLRRRRVPRLPARSRRREELERRARQSRPGEARRTIGSPSSGPSSRVAGRARASPMPLVASDELSASSSPTAALEVDLGRGRSRARPRSAIKKIS